MSAVSEAKVGAGGWQLVPVEPTEEMFEGFRSVNCKRGERGMEEFTSFYGDYGNWFACYRAMLAAAPEPSSYHPERDALLVEMEKALAPFAAEAGEFDGISKDRDPEDLVPGVYPEHYTIADLRRARDLLNRLRATQAKAGT